MMNEQKIIGGLRELPKDDRDLKLGAIYSLPKLEELPDNFIIGFPKVKDQKDSDFCAAFASCSASELQEDDTELCPEWTFAVAKYLSGENPDTFGLDLRTAMKAHQKFGALEKKDSPFSLENKPQSFLRNINNWPDELYKKAIKHKKESFFYVTGPYDNYDNIRASMWKFRNEKRAVVFGVIFSWSLSQVFMDTYQNKGGGHALCNIGFTPKCLYIQNSYGESAGEAGRHYFSREVINRFVDLYGAFMFIDMPKEDARYMIENGIKINDNWIIGLLKVVLTFFGLRKLFT